MKKNAKKLFTEPEEEKKNDFINHSTLLKRYSNSEYIIERKLSN